MLLQVGQLEQPLEQWLGEDRAVLRSSHHSAAAAAAAGYNAAVASPVLQVGQLEQPLERWLGEDAQHAQHPRRQQVRPRFRSKQSAAMSSM
jgi:hypothetical protein